MSRVSPRPARPTAAAPASTGPDAAAPASTATADASKPPVSSEDTPAPRGAPKQNKVDYRTEGTALLTVWPADFDSKVHKPLKQEDFSAEDVYFNHRAEQYEKRGAEFRQKALLFQQYGSADTRKAAEKYTKQFAAMAALQAQLEAQGVDMNLLMQGLEEKAKAEAATATTA